MTPPKIIFLNILYVLPIGAFLTDVYNVFNNENFFNDAIAAFVTEPFLAVCKTLIIIGVLAFYCCDYLNNHNTTNYKWNNFVSGLIVVAIMFLTFKSINLRSSVTNKNHFVQLDTLSICFLGFMLVYLIRYGILHKKYSNEDLKKYTFLAFKEAILALLFFLVFIMNRFQLVPFELLVGTTTTLILFAACLYIYVLKKN